MTTIKNTDNEIRRFAVFDIDGTVFRWQLYHELFDSLHRRGVITNEDAEPIYAARRSWRDRKSSFSDYELLLVAVMEKKILGIKESLLIEAVDEIIARHGEHAYRYTTELIKELKNKGYSIIAISGSQHQAVVRFAAIHNIDIAYGVHYKTENGIIVEQIAPVYGRKAEILQMLVKEHNLSWDESYGVGDTSTDAAMLSLVQHPIAFNPDEKLYAQARDERWPIVVERKNMIYRLESDGNSFVLA